MRMWSRPIANIIAGVFDFGMGWLDLFRHRYFGAVILIACGVAVIALTITRWRRERQLDLVRAQIGELEAQEAQRVQLLQMQLTPEEMQEASTKAIANLAIVAKATGAKVYSESQEVLLRIDGFDFHISHRHICRTDRATGERVGTCLTYGLGGMMPVPEQIAAVLLLVKNDPTIFAREQGGK